MRSRLKSVPLQKKEKDILRINEIFFSVQGESTRLGLPTIFIRLTGCPLRCRYCDTVYAFYEGKKISIDSIINSISQYQIRRVTVTGGEPLAQYGCHTLLSRLCDENFEVSLETSGAISLENIDKRVIKIMDIKTPGSMEEKKTKFKNIGYLTNQDEIKFVICNRIDYVWAKQKIFEYNLINICEVLFSPEHEALNPIELANWILKDKLNVRLQLQIHKYLWGDTKGK